MTVLPRRRKGRTPFFPEADESAQPSAGRPSAGRFAFLCTGRRPFLLLLCTRFVTSAAIKPACCSFLQPLTFVILAPVFRHVLGSFSSQNCIICIASLEARSAEHFQPLQIFCTKHISLRISTRLNNLWPVQVRRSAAPSQALGWLPPRKLRRGFHDVIPDCSCVRGPWSSLLQCNALPCPSPVATGQHGLEDSLCAAASDLTEVWADSRTFSLYTMAPF